MDQHFTFVWQSKKTRFRTSFPKVITWHYANFAQSFQGCYSKPDQIDPENGTYSVVAARWNLWTRPGRVPWWPGGPRWYDWRTSFSATAALLQQLELLLLLLPSVVFRSAVPPNLWMERIAACWTAAWHRKTRTHSTRDERRHTSAVWTGGREKTLWPLQHSRGLSTSENFPRTRTEAKAMMCDWMCGARLWKFCERWERAVISGENQCQECCRE